MPHTRFARGARDDCTRHFDSGAGAASGKSVDRQRSSLRYDDFRRFDYFGGRDGFALRDDRPPMRRCTQPPLPRYAMPYDARSLFAARLPHCCAIARLRPLTVRAAIYEMTLRRWPVSAL